MHINRSNQTSGVSGQITEEIFYTYLLFAFSIVSYLFGTQILISYDFAIFCIFGSFLLLLAVLTTQSPFFLILFSFVIGMNHNPIFEYLNVVDPTIITETLNATMMIFFGLTIIAFKIRNYNTFVLYGLLYSTLSTAIWLAILNMFYQNMLVDVFLMYISIMIFTGYIIIDTHSLLKNPHQSPVIHALQLFLDFVNLFINLLKFQKHIRRKNF